jgi:cystathionine beta-lyase family protein involved in aluminum resistance
MNILTKHYGVNEALVKKAEAVEEALAQEFKKIEKIQELNQLWVLDCFREERIQPSHFAPSYGYGYDDTGREKLRTLFARIFKAEDAIVRPQIASGTHALALALQGIVKKGTRILSASGAPYDTLEGIIGHKEYVEGSLCDMGASYKELPLKNKRLDLEGLKEEAKNADLIMLQRSRGYQDRPSLLISEIEEASKIIRSANKDAVIFVDNCYGEFVEEKEPIEAGADIMVGSLIKNAGGGIAPTGAYIAGKRALIERIAYRMTAPGIGDEVGSYAGGYLPFFQGIFLAPQTVAQALKGAVFTAKMLEEFGYTPSPKWDERRGCIIQSVCLNNKENLIKFCRQIQAVSPVEAFVTPEPWAMPGYTDEVIMAAGTFIQGASIELSGDAPIREPYMFYMQGGIVYHQVKAAILCALQNMNGED